MISWVKERMMSDRTQDKDPNEPPKTQWLWLIGLSLGGMVGMYLLAKLTRMFVTFLGLK